MVMTKEEEEDGGDGMFMAMKISMRIARGVTAMGRVSMRLRKRMRMFSRLFLLHAGQHWKSVAGAIAEAGSVGGESESIE